MEQFKQYADVENFENSCDVICLVGELSPHNTSKLIFGAGKNYRNIYKVKTLDFMELQESFQNKYIESFQNNNQTDPGDTYNEILKELTPYKLKECFIDKFLYTNFYGN